MLLDLLDTILENNEKVQMIRERFGTDSMFLHGGILLWKYRPPERNGWASSRTAI